MRKIVSLLTLLLLFTAVAWSQGKISGTIKDQNGDIVPFATVNVKGTKTTVAADANANFTISATNGETLVVSAVGIDKLEVPVGTSSVLSVTVNRSSANITDVVVTTALGIKREKRSLTYAVQTVNSDQLNKSGTGNPLSELEGKASGLTVINSSGDPGSGTYIRLRGVTSITGDNQPLMVVDGVPIDNSINNFDPTGAGAQAGGASGNLTGGAQPTNRGIDLNPNDIESITVLKGPAATALWGIKAASGALIITTKKGASGANTMSIDFNSSTTVSKTNKLPGLQDKYSQGSGGLYNGPETGRNSSWGAAIDTLSWDGVSNIWDPHGNIVSKSDPSAKIPVTPYDRYEFFQTGVALDNNLAISGGSANSTFRISYGNLHQTGIIPKTQYNKNSLSINGSSKLNSKISVSASLNYIGSQNNKVQQGSNTSGIMLGLLRTPPTFDNSYGLKDAANDERAYVQAATGLDRNYRGGVSYDNPYWTINRNPFKEGLNRVLGNAQVTYQFADWISANYRFGGDIYAQDAKNFYDIHSAAFPAGYGVINDYFNSQYNSDLTLNMKKNLGKDFSGSLLLGHNYFYNYSHTRTTIGNSLIVPTFFDMSNALSYNSVEGDGQKRTMAFYGEASLNYKTMLYLDITGRRETSSTLPTNHRNFFYPSIGLTWVFTELPGLKTSNILSFGKLRASYAQVGKDAPISGLKTYYLPASINDGFTTGESFPIVNNNNPIGSYLITSTTSVIGNPDLKPEKTNSYELGLDLGFLKNRISFSGTYYYSKTNDAILTVPYTFTTGFASKLLNAAVITNRGYELSLNTTPVKTKNFSWDLDLNWSTNKNLVQKLAAGVDQLTIAGFVNGEVDAFAGEPFGQIYGSVYVRANSDIKGHSLPGGPLLINDNPNDPGFGMPIVSAQSAIIGNVNPKWFGTIINNFNFKGITLGFQIDIRHGGAIWDGTRGALSYFGTSKETENRGKNVTFQGLSGHLDAEGNIVHYDASGAEVSGAGSTNAAATTYNQYYWQNIGSSFIGPAEATVEDGSFVKLRQASIGYVFPKSLIGKTFNNLSLTFFANNIILHTKYQGVDPETSLAGPANGQGLDYFNNPSAKNFGVRLNVGLK